jgi:hypothetical protein
LHRKSGELLGQIRRFAQDSCLCVCVVCVSENCVVLTESGWSPRGRLSSTAAVQHMCEAGWAGVSFGAAAVVWV